MKIVSLDSLPTGTTSHANAGKKKQMVASNFIPHIHQFSQVSFEPHEVVTQHSHPDMYEVMYVEEGSGVMKINGKDYSVSKGTCVTVEPNEKHDVKVTGANNLVLLVIGIKV